MRGCEGELVREVDWSSMFPQFASTAASLTRATSLMNRVGTDAYLYDDPEDGNIAMLLDSKFEVEKVEGMKRLIALVSQGRDVSSFFPQVCVLCSVSAVLLIRTVPGVWFELNGFFPR